MIVKLHSLQRKEKESKSKVSKFQSTDTNDNSYNDYESGSITFTLNKIDGKNKKKFQTSMYSTRLKTNVLAPILTEVDPQLEATPGSRNKHINSSQQLSPLRENRKDTSISSFNSAYNKQMDKKQKKQNLSHNSLNTRKIIDSYIREDKFMNKKLTPLRTQIPMFGSHTHNQRYVCPNYENEGMESSENRLSKIYIRSEKIKEKFK